MFGLNKNQKCKSGYSRKNNKCVRQNKKRVEAESCKLDGKTCYKKGDKSLKPIIARAGGKSQVAKKIINKAPPHDTYVEPFVGGGAVYLKKPLAQKSVINDKDKDVITSYKAFKNGRGFKKCNMTPSKKKFDKIKKKNSKTACDVAYLNKLSFGSNMTSYADKKFTGKRNSETGITYQNTHQEEYKEKLKQTTIMNQDFAKVMKQYDSKQTFHYLDPPYDGTQNVYKEGTSLQPEEVCKVAKRMRGKVMISYNDSHRVRKACKGLKFQKINTRFTLGADSNNTGSKEVLITNY